MTLVKWNPTRNLGLLTGFGDLDSVVSDFFAAPFGLTGLNDPGWSPRVDVKETEKEFEVHAELPGIDKKEIEITVNDGVLAIKGEKKHEVNDKNGEGENTYRFRESGYGKFERSFRFSEPVIEDRITAKYKNGVLSINVPKAEVPEPHKVEIK